jgi:hypothetical protein
MTASPFQKPDLPARRTGELLTLAELSRFEVFITVDHGIPYRQKFVGRRLAIVLLRARSNQLIDLLPHADSCLRRLQTIRPGEVVIIG